ncbi:MAG: peptidase S9 family protein [Planctomycetaceae bacterium]|nr:peptidase S9 family protein [Planctomycetaceae bacterium]
MFRKLTVYLTLLSTILNQQLVNASPTLEGNDVFDIEYADDPIISPNGRWVIYDHVRADEATDKFTRNLICHNVDEGTSSVLLKRYSGFSDVAWHPSSNHFAIAAQRDKQSYLLLIVPGRRTPSKVIPLDNVPKHLNWNPTGTAIIYNSFVPKDQKRLVPSPEDAVTGKWAPPVIEIERDIYRRDGQGYVKHGNHQIFKYDADGDYIKQLTDGPYDHTGPFGWDGDSKVLFSGQLYPDWEHTPRQDYIYAINTDTQQIDKLIDIDGPVSSPQYLSDTDSIVFLGFKDLKHSYQQTDLHIYDKKRRDIRNVTLQFDRDISAFRICSNGLIYFRYDDKGTGRIASYNPVSNLLSRDLAKNVGGVSIGRPYQGGNFSISDTGVLAYPQASLSRPAEIAVSSGSDTTLITNVTKTFTDTHSIGSSRRFSYKSTFDDEMIDGWVIFPPGYKPNSDSKYPLILEIHGGPFANYGSRFAMEPQLYAAAGYIVVYTNPRGSTSYGERFAQLINRNYPQQGDFEDLMAAVDYSIKNYSVDPDRLYVTGGSGGGILTAWIVTKTDRFKAAVSQKPVINWETLAYTSDGYFYFPQDWFDGPPTSVPDDYRRRSPLSYVDKVKTPTMLMTGEQDWRTPITEAEQFYQGLKLNDVDTILIRVPESSHSIAARPSRIWMKLNYLNAWFSRYK